MTPRRVAILGSTGSIGTQALDVCAALPGRFEVVALAAHRNCRAVADQARRFGVRRLAMGDPAAADELRALVPGADVLDDVASLAADPGVDVVLNAVVGAAGLRASLAALDAGATLALANKESCVAGGELVRRRIDAGARVVPVDSEHAAVHMCIAGEDAAGVTSIVLTASGGPFRGRRRDELERVTVAEALAHPTWRMGPKITVDSATLMNKGLEVIEAHVLFGLPYDRIGIVCHPQSVVHCLVGFVDGSWKASLSPPDMRVPIAYALGHPERPAWGAPTVDWGSSPALTFEELDLDAFACVRLAYAAGRTGGTAPAVLNAANETAVQAFLDSRLRFPAIADVVAAVLDEHDACAVRTLDDVLRADAWARVRARELVAARS